jgi:ABC-type multidrug transport system fused ATPase/permease subunit
MKEGQLVECGTHDELLSKDGSVYARLHGMQMEMQTGV